MKHPITFRLERHFEFVRKKIRARLRGAFSEDVNDLTQQVLLAAWRKRDTLTQSDDRSLQKWLAKVSRDEVNSHFRRRSCKERYVDRSSVEPPDASGHLWVDEVVIQDLRRVKLPLDDGHLTVLRLLLMGKSPVEIQEELGISQSTVYARLKKIRRVLEDSAHWYQSFVVLPSAVGKRLEQWFGGAALLSVAFVVVLYVDSTQNDSGSLPRPPRQSEVGEPSGVAVSGGRGEETESAEVEPESAALVVPTSADPQRFPPVDDEFEGKNGPRADRAKRAKRRKRRATTTAEVVPTLGPGEWHFISAARKALSNGEASEAIEALDEHQRRFPGGAASRLREMLRVNALCAAGRAHDAQAATEAFVASHGALRRRLACDALP